MPIYRQIVNQVRYQVSSGGLAPGDELPPIRVMAEQLLINPNTVARAYRELELEGLVEKRRTSGTFIAAAGSPLARRERLRIITDRIDSLLAEADQLGFSCDDLIEQLRLRSLSMRAGRKEER